MIIFEGDYVRLIGQQHWAEVVYIVDSMHVELSNGVVVEASEQAISQALSAQEYKQSMMMAQ
jgi:hypothetical protein